MLSKFVASALTVHHCVRAVHNVSKRGEKSKRDENKISSINGTCCMLYTAHVLFASYFSCTIYDYTTLAAPRRERREFAIGELAARIAAHLIKMLPTGRVCVYVCAMCIAAIPKNLTTNLCGWHKVSCIHNCT